MRSLFPFFLFPPRFPIMFIFYITSSGAGGRQGGVFDAAFGAALLSVVDMPDLGTVNRQG